MVSLVLTVSALNSWTYSDFMASPPTPQPPPSAAVHASRLPDATILASEPVVTTPSLTATQSPAKAKTDLPPVNASNSMAGHYRLADATGQVWEHPDPQWLQEFVQGRNQQLFGLPR